MTINKLASYIKDITSYLNNIQEVTGITNIKDLSDIVTTRIAKYLIRTASERITISEFRKNVAEGSISLSEILRQVPDLKKTFADSLQRINPTAEIPAEQLSKESSETFKEGMKYVADAITYDASQKAETNIKEFCDLAYASAGAQSSDEFRRLLMANGKISTDLLKNKYEEVRSAVASDKNGQFKITESAHKVIKDKRQTFSKNVEVELVKTKTSLEKGRAVLQDLIQQFEEFLGPVLNDVSGDLPEAAKLKESKKQLQENMKENEEEFNKVKQSLLDILKANVEDKQSVKQIEELYIKQLDIRSNQRDFEKIFDDINHAIEYLYGEKPKRKPESPLPVDPSEKHAALEDAEDEFSLDDESDVDSAPLSLFDETPEEPIDTAIQNQTKEDVSPVSLTTETVDKQETTKEEPKTVVEEEIKDDSATTSPTNYFEILEQVEAIHDSLSGIKRSYSRNNTDRIYTEDLLSSATSNPKSPESKINLSQNKDSLGESPVTNKVISDEIDKGMADLTEKVRPDITTGLRLTSSQNLAVLREFGIELPIEDFKKSGREGISYLEAFPAYQKLQEEDITRLQDIEAIDKILEDIKTKGIPFDALKQILKQNNAHTQKTKGSKLYADSAIEYYLLKQDQEEQKPQTAQASINSIYEYLELAKSIKIAAEEVDPDLEAAASDAVAETEDSVKPSDKDSEFKRTNEAAIANSKEFFIKTLDDTYREALTNLTAGESGKKVYGGLTDRIVEFESILNDVQAELDKVKSEYVPAEGEELIEKPEGWEKPAKTTPEERNQRQEQAYKEFMSKSTKDASEFADILLQRIAADAQSITPEQNSSLSIARRDLFKNIKTNIMDNEREFVESLIQEYPSLKDSIQSLTNSIDVFQSKYSPKLGIVRAGIVKIIDILKDSGLQPSSVPELKVMNEKFNDHNITMQDLVTNPYSSAIQAAVNNNDITFKETITKATNDLLGLKDALNALRQKSYSKVKDDSKKKFETAYNEISMNLEAIVSGIAKEPTDIGLTSFIKKLNKDILPKFQKTIAEQDEVTKQAIMDGDTGINAAINTKKEEIKPLTTALGEASTITNAYSPKDIETLQKLSTHADKLNIPNPLKPALESASIPSTYAPQTSSSSGLSRLEEAAKNTVNPETKKKQRGQSDNKSNSSVYPDLESKLTTAIKFCEGLQGNIMKEMDTLPFIDNLGYVENTKFESLGRFVNPTSYAHKTEKTNPQIQHQRAIITKLKLHSILELLINPNQTLSGEIDATNPTVNRIVTGLSKFKALILNAQEEDHEISSNKSLAEQYTNISKQLYPQDGTTPSDNTRKELLSQQEELTPEASKLKDTFSSFFADKLNIKIDENDFKKLNTIVKRGGNFSSEELQSVFSDILESKLPEETKKKLSEVPNLHNIKGGKDNPDVPVKYNEETGEEEPDTETTFIPERLRKVPKVIKVVSYDKTDNSSFSGILYNMQRSLKHIKSVLKQVK